MVAARDGPATSSPPHSLRANWPRCRAALAAGERGGVGLGDGAAMLGRPRHRRARPGGCYARQGQHSDEDEGLRRLRDRRQSASAPIHLFAEEDVGLARSGPSKLASDSFRSNEGAGGVPGIPQQPVERRQAGRQLPTSATSTVRRWALDVCCTQCGTLSHRAPGSPLAPSTGAPAVVSSTRAPEQLPSVKAFVEGLSSDEAFRSRLAGARTPEEHQEMARATGYDLGAGTCLG